MVDRVAALEAELADARKRLQETERKLTFLLDTLPITLSEIGADRVFQSIGGRGFRVLNWPDSAIVGRVYGTTSPGAVFRDRSGVVRPTAELAEPVMAGEPIVGTLELAGYTHEYYLSPRRAPDGSIDGMLLASLDCTEIVSARRDFARMFEGNEDGFLLVDRDVHVTAINAKAVEVLGGSLGTVLGKPLSTAFPVFDGAAFRDGYARALRDKTAVRLTEPLADDRWIEVVAYPWDGGLAVFVRDVTAVRAAEAERAQLVEQLRQAQKMEAVGQLAGGVAHDFNNMLTVIHGFTKLALGRVPEGATRDALTQCLRASERAASLTRHLLALSRRQPLSVGPVDIGELVRSMELLFARVLPATIRLDVRIADLVPMAECDASQLEQVMLNLVVNGRDALPDGGWMAIDVSARELDAAAAKAAGNLAPGNYVSISVADNGIGMDDATAARIFEPFFTTKPRGSGTGLGLAVVYGIVTQLGGHVAVRSQVGRGSTFEVLLPVATSTAATRPASTAELSSPGGRETVLLVEDDEQVRNLVRLVLVEKGYTVLETINGREALELATALTSALDLVISDVMMPDLGGRALATALREMRPELPILFISGYVSDAAGHDEVSSDHEHFLPKPFAPEALAARVRAILDRRR